jgi:hypothetical protein
MYWYPDGTSGQRPSDGQVFYVYDHQQNVKSIWQWDDLKQQWFDITNNIKPLQPPIYHVVPSGKYSNLPLPQSLMDLDNLEITIGYGDTDGWKCECGSEKTGSPRHSTWCKKYHPEQ